MITDAGRDDIAINYVADKYTKVKIGQSGDDTAASQTELDSVVATKTVTPSVVNSELVWTVNFLGSEIGSQGVSELGIFHKDDDTLLSRVTFKNTGVVASNDTVTFTISMELN